jgi:hypothetical protein
VIRRWHFRQGIPIREIKRRTGLRNTIRNIRADAVEPVFKVPDRPKLDPFAEKLTGWTVRRANRASRSGQPSSFTLISLLGV